MRPFVFGSDRGSMFAFNMHSDPQPRIGRGCSIGADYALNCQLIGGASRRKLAAVIEHSAMSEKCLHAAYFPKI
jgi:hypothetical protein